MTFSIVARCERTGMFGVAISSSSPAVAARCSYARAGVGAVASQNVTDPEIGPLALDLMAGGMSAMQGVAEVRRRRRFIEYRQVLAVDASGGTAIHSGPNALGIWASAHSNNAASGGNLLAHAGVPQAMLRAFAASTGHLGDRLIGALRGGLDAGGEAGPVHSAGILVVDRVSWPVIDLRCDWSEDCPIAALATIWDIYRPQVDAYVQRALDPREAPSYGVPGDE
ncbi:MAG: DUF1028 domain-containing protein [Geminicoccaceae bacterium]